MKADVFKIFIFGLALAVVPQIAVRADNSLCNRAMIFLAHARGDVTAEFKRRIAFLLDTGKIDSSELERMLSSETAVSPFDLGRHIGVETVPHERAIAALLSGGNLDWAEVRRFGGEMLKRMEIERVARARAETETRKVVYPWIEKIYRLRDPRLHTPFSDFRLFEDSGRMYAVVGSFNGYIAVFNALDGNVVRVVKLGNERVESVELVRLGQQVYVVALSGSRVMTIMDCLMGGIKACLRVGDKQADPNAQHGDENSFGMAMLNLSGEPCAAVYEADGGMDIVDLATGIIRKKIDIGEGQHQAPVAFTSGKDTYVVANGLQHVDIVDVLGGRSIKVDVGGKLYGAPAVFEDGQTTHVAVVADDDHVYVIDALAGRVERRIPTRDKPVLSITPRVIQAGADVHLVVAVHSENGPILRVIDVAGAEIIREIQADARLSADLGDVGDGIWLVVTDKSVTATDLMPDGIALKANTGKGLYNPTVFRIDGIEYVLGINADNLYVIRLRGELAPLDKGDEEK